MGGLQIYPHPLRSVVLVEHAERDDPPAGFGRSSRDLGNNQIAGGQHMLGSAFDLGRSIGDFNESVRTSGGFRGAFYADQYGDCAATSKIFDFAQRHRSEAHTSELQSLMRIYYAVFCLKKIN